MFPGVGMQELLLAGVVAVLLFGKNLPEVARSLGKSYRDFKSGLNEIQSQIHSVENDYHSTVHAATSDDQDLDKPSAPKFVPPQSEPEEA